MRNSIWFGTKAVVLAGAGLLTAAALIAAGPAVSAADGDVDAKTARSAISRFKSAFKTKDLLYKQEAIEDLAKVQHPTVAKEMLSKLKSKDVNVRAWIVGALGGQKSSAKTVGSKLKRVLDKEEEPKVLAAAVESVGRLEYTKARELVQDLIKSQDDKVVVAVFGVFGAWKDDSALDKMASWWETWPDEKGFVTVSATVDTGTAGSADQQAAAAAGRGKQAAHNAWRQRPTCTRALRTALKQITDKGFERPDDLREYLNNPKGYKDPDLVFEKKKEPELRQIWKEFNAVEMKAKDLLVKELGEESKDTSRRSKVFWGHFTELREELCEARNISVSELYVIRAKAKKDDWARE